MDFDYIYKLTYHSNFYDFDYEYYFETIELLHKYVLDNDISDYLVSMVKVYE